MSLTSKIKEPLKKARNLMNVTFLSGILIGNCVAIGPVVYRDYTKPNYDCKQNMVLMGNLYSHAPNLNEGQGSIIPVQNLENTYFTISCTNNKYIIEEITFTQETNEPTQNLDNITKEYSL